MALFWPSIGAKDFLIGSMSWLNDTGDVKVRLYKNDLTPVFGTVLGGFTEANFTGYAAIDVDDWADDAAVSSLRYRIKSAADKVFTMTGTGAGSNNIYGYYITSTIYGLLYAERAAAPPLVMASVGQTLTVRPQFEFGNCG